MGTIKNTEGILFHAEKGQYGDEYQSHILEIYKLYVEMADRVSERRQQANAFYLSVSTLLLGVIAYIQENSTVFSSILFCVSGILISFLWIRNILSYKDLNSGKFAVINLLESKLPVSPYNAEWSHLERGKNNSKYRPFHKIEALVPVLFIVVYFIALVYSILNI